MNASPNVEPGRLNDAAPDVQYNGGPNSADTYLELRHGYNTTITRSEGELRSVVEASRFD